MKLSLRFSPCPNDCFMLDAIVNQRIDLEGLDLLPEICDIETLNEAALGGDADVTKLSYHAFLHCVDRYEVLDAGSALGRGCGPLLVSRRSISRTALSTGRLRIATPGQYTTANLLLAMAFPAAGQRVHLTFSDIESAVMHGAVDAGVIIHENRFTYSAKGLKKIADLGELWEDETSTPIPLGAFVIKRTLSPDVKQRVNRVLRHSIGYAFAHPAASWSFIRAHAQEIDEGVIRQHVDLYVNEYSMSLGVAGRCAVERLFARARTLGLVPATSTDICLFAVAR